MKFKIGHVLIKVKDLDKAIQQFEKMGFSVTLGSNDLFFRSVFY